MHPSTRRNWLCQRATPRPVLLVRAGLLLVVVLGAACTGEQAPPTSRAAAATTSTIDPTVTGPEIRSLVTNQAGAGAGIAIIRELQSPWGLAVDASGNVYTSDVVGNFVARTSRDSATEIVAKDLSAPRGLAVVTKGAVYIANTLANEILRMDPTGSVTRVAGNGTYGFSGDGGPATAASLASPIDVAIDGAGVVYVSESASARVRRIGPDGTIATVVTGGQTASSDTGDPASDPVRLTEPSGLVAHEQGLYIADEAASRVYWMGPDGVLELVAGNGRQAFSGDGGPAVIASLANPTGLAIGPDGHLLIADSTNMRVRQVAR